MKSGRTNNRFTRRLEAEFTADNKKYRGISSNLSISGLFIRTQHAFIPDTIIDIIIHLPDSKDAKLKGRVIRSIKTPVVSIKNGMGIEIIENNPVYINFIKSVLPDENEKTNSESPKMDTSFHQTGNEKPQADPEPTEFTIIACVQCNVKNKVNNAKLPLGPKCGKCRYPLTAQN